MTHTVKGADSPLMLLTRPSGQSERFASICRAAGFAGRVVISPVLQIRTLPVTVDPRDFEVLVFTSENGVSALASQKDLGGHRAFAVGQRTCAAAQAHGMTCTAADGSVEALLDLLMAHNVAGPILRVRGVHARGDLSARLAARGIEATDVTVYDQQSIALNADATFALDEPHRVVLPLFSPRSAQLVGDHVRNCKAPLTVLALSDAVAEAWNGPERVAVAARPRVDAMARLVMQSLS